MASIYKGLLALQQLSCLWLLLVWALCLNHCTLPVGEANELIAKTDVSNQNETGVCKSVDIRNSIKAFESLIGCRVVEGFVQILLFDTVDSSHFANLSFPLLTEITDYLLLYRVSGLLSLGQLFPNLVVIRGYSLLFGYAFIVFEMPNLQEINLYSLTDIMRGSIRIDKNPSLCFVHSINWKLIAHDQHGHFIMSIKSENECPLCPGDDETVENGCHPFPTKAASRSIRHMCWNAEHCQKVCPGNCTGRACDEEGNCCNEMCLGGCSVNDNNTCTVCKNFTMINGNQTKCLSNCPIDLYEYLHRKCVSQDECIRFRDNRVEQDFPYRIHESSCVMECPKGFMDDTLNRKCVKCEGNCEKVCPGRIVDSISSIRELGGCTHINGSLEIQIRGGQNIVHELEENLKLITVIDGYLKIVRSFPLVSLSFFKNLDTIRGNVLENNRYVISLLDNQNLQDIWDWTNRTLKVSNGRLFFHFNPKLCLEKIRILQENTNLPKFEEHEVSQATNGDKIACNLSTFTVNVTGIQSKEVELRWQKYNIIDPRKLLAFLIYYIEAPYTNVTLYDNRDACGDYGWNFIQVGIPDNYTVIPHMSRILRKLRPYTQYAFYITTYTIATEQVGAQSKIQYFRTDADQPSVPMDFKIISNSSDSLTITWAPPTDPNGNITYYKITIIKQTETTQFSSLAKQDYCNKYIQLQPAKPQESSSPTVPVQPNDTCVCRSKQKTKIAIKESDVLSQISFEDELLNKVYIRRTQKDKNQSRKKRDTDLSDQDLKKTKTEVTTRNSTSYNGNITYDNITFTTDALNLYVEKLHHYTMYSVILQACRAEVTGNKKRECSSEYKNLYKTLLNESADNITSGVTIDHKNLTSVTLKWKPPDQPNGFILYYRIEYSRVDFDNPYIRCINHYAFKNNGFKYTLNGLNPGNYWVRVQAVSQAKLDNEYTERVNFYIEESSNYDLLYIFGSLICLIVIMLFMYVLYKRHMQKPLIITVNPDYVSTEYEPDEWEVLRKKIELHKELGQGSFGMVYEGIARDIKGNSQIPCAIKTVNEHATNRERIEFLNEASVMKAFDTTHVVKLLGVVSQGQPTLVVMELMANGDLKSYLRSHRPESDNYSSNIIRQPPTLKRILQMAIEIADGMAYLSAKKFVHRDLAARNCMVSEDLTVKIGDFGMTRDIYETDYYRKGTKGLLPVRWMAPESLKDGVFSSSSDIWSYGVVLWEMATLASQPYQGLSNDQVLRYVIDGGIMERPENCPDKLYLLMMYCWKHKYTDRPTFLEICSLLLDDASPLFAKVSFYHSAAGMEARSSRNNHLISHDDASTPLRLTNDLDGKYSLDSSGPDSQQDDDLVGNTHLEFLSYPVQKDSSATVNGYLGTNASNGTTA